MSSHEPLTLIALMHRLAAVDHYARERVAGLLCIREHQAAALLGIADGRAITIDELAADLDMSAGGARAFAHWLRVEALVRPEPAPAHRPGIALRLAPGAATELAAALGPLTDALEAVAAEFPDRDLGAVAAYLTVLADALERHRRSHSQ